MTVLPHTFATAVREFTLADPFRPFVIELVNGMAIAVHQPEAVCLDGDLVRYGCPNGDVWVTDATCVARVMVRTETPDSGIPF